MKIHIKTTVNVAIQKQPKTIELEDTKINVQEITITTDGGNRYFIRESEPDVLSIQRDAYVIIVFPISPSCVEVT